MFYDLNIAWSPSTTKDQLLQTLTQASLFGYGTVALNQTLTESPPANAKAPFPDLSSSSSDNANPKLPNILHRATLTLSDPAAYTFRPQILGRVYDILAIRPTTLESFQHACLTLDIPLISLDLSQHFPWHFKPKPCMTAVGRGVRFEVCYSQALSPGAEARARATFIGNVTSLVRATRGRGIVISSEAKSALGLRAPADVANLLSVWGLGSEKGMQGMGSIPRSVVVNEGIKRNGFRGVVNVVKTAERDPHDVEKTKQQQQQHQTNKQDKKQKRKGGEDEGQGGSKRQNKKMKMVSRDAGSAKK